jgi:hypothetical protein
MSDAHTSPKPPPPAAKPDQPGDRILQIGGCLPEIVGKLLALRRKIMHVATGAEILALAGQQHRADVRRAMTHHDGIAERLQEFDIHAVGGSGPIKPEMRDAVRDAQQNWSPIDHWQAHLSSIRIFSFSSEA